jgi:hypothetical protein
MKRIYKLSFVYLVLAGSCKPDEKKILLPDLRPNFSYLLNQKDSTLVLDSFYFIKTDTMNEKKALIHQRFPYFNILTKINGQLAWVSNKRDSFHKAPSANDLETIAYLNSEKNFVNHEIDSLSQLIVHADSLTPVGYRAFYKATVSKKGQFVVSDTVPYSISLQMKVSDWDRNLEKLIDSLAVGKTFRSRNGR